MASDLKNKTIKGVKWGFIDNIMNIGLIAVVNIILSRLLTDSDFGLIGITTVFMSLSTSMVDSGFSGALTRKQFVTEKDFNTVFYFNLFVSFLLYILLFFIAPPISHFFNQPILIPIIRILGLSLIINALGIVQKVILVRKIDFKTQAIISAISSVVSGIVSLYLALKGYGVWSLVVLQIMRFLIATILLWIFSHWMPALSFSYKSFKEMFSFGGKLLLTSIITIISNEIYSLMIGRVYSPGLVGQYSKANKFRDMVTSNVGIVMQRVGYPVLSSIQDESERQIRAYRKILKTTVLISFTGVLGLAAISEALVIVLIGNQWIPTIKFLRILALAGIFVPVITTSGNIINANGRSDITLGLEIVKTALTVIPILLGIFFNMEALLWGIAGISFIMFLLYSIYVSKVINYKVSMQLKDILPIFIVSAVMAAVVFAISFISLPYIVTLLIQLITGFVIIVAIYEFIYKCEEYDEIKAEFLTFLEKIFKRKV